MRSCTLLIITLFAVLAVVYGETTCQAHKRNSARSAHGMEWDIQCDSEGFYKDTQCTKDEPKKQWCACYNKEEAITSPSRKMRHCKCPLARDEATKANPNAVNDNCNVPQCTNTGKYESKQCCPSTGKCRCVNSDTGATTVPETSETSLQCPTN